MTHNPSSAARAIKRISAHSPRNLGCLIFIPLFFMMIFSDRVPYHPTQIYRNLNPSITVFPCLSHQIKTRPAKAAHPFPLTLTMAYLTPQTNKITTKITPIPILGMRAVTGKITNLPPLRNTERPIGIAIVYL